MENAKKKKEMISIQDQSKKGMGYSANTIGSANAIKAENGKKKAVRNNLLSDKNLKKGILPGN
ncbi:putative cytochrome c-type biogenesis protein CcsB [Leptospira johnsonii]|uniref:Putative cytochrome c-type biogenesis protein CcsB n=1 Tax=Leptospira johnsonii TaxID=1917820 RepID=A0A2P2D4U4_9LEPT|nr:putative cytochrome c-type biogenesis protein CcsB [Leptospira johnsonii]